MMNWIEGFREILRKEEVLEIKMENESEIEYPNIDEQELIITIVLKDEVSYESLNDLWDSLCLEIENFEGVDTKILIVIVKHQSSSVWNTFNSMSNKEPIKKYAELLLKRS